MEDEISAIARPCRDDLDVVPGFLFCHFSFGELLSVVFSLFQDDNFSLSLLNELCLKYGLQTHLSHSPLPQKMEELREFLRREIKKELKIKEGAENLRKVARDRKSVSDVNRMVKSSNTKLTDMQQELQELESQILVSSSSSSSSAARGDKHTPNSSLSGEGKTFL